LHGHGRHRAPSGHRSDGELVTGAIGYGVRSLIELLLADDPWQGCQSRHDRQ
jgi:hypothetical protein